VPLRAVVAFAVAEQLPAPVVRCVVAVLEQPLVPVPHCAMAVAERPPAPVLAGLLAGSESLTDVLRAPVQGCFLSAEADAECYEPARRSGSLELGLRSPVASPAEA
jgi:hypothetical protein